MLGYDNFFCCDLSCYESHLENRPAKYSNNTAK